MHVPINVKSPNNINKWHMGFNSAFKWLIRKFVIFLGEVYFTLTRNVNNHSTMYWCSESPRNVYEVPLRNLIAGGWCVFSCAQNHTAYDYKKYVYIALTVALN
jgi:hypothetical protein